MFKFVSFHCWTRIFCPGSEKFHFEEFRGLEALRKIDVQTYRHFQNKETSQFQLFLEDLRRAEHLKRLRRLKA